MFEGEEFGGEGFDELDGGAGRADHVAGAEVGRVDVREVQGGELACDGPVDGGVLDLDGFDDCGFVGGEGQDRVADLQRAGVDASGDAERGAEVAAEDVGDGETERFLELARRQVDGLERREEGWACVPVCGWVGDGVDDVFACEAGERDEGDAFFRRSWLR